MTNDPAFSEDYHSLFGDYSEEAAASDAAAAKSGTDFDKFEMGNNARRYLPPLAGQTSIFRARYVHALRDGKEKKYRPVNCPKHADKKADCGVCAYIEELRASGAKADADTAYEINAVYSPLAFVFDLGPNADRKITLDNASQFLRVQDVKRSILQGLTALRGNRLAGGDYTHPLNGFPVNIEKKEVSGNTKYEVQALPRLAGPIVPPSDFRGLVELLPSMDSLLYVPTYEETLATLDEWLKDVEAAKAAAAPAAGRRR